MAEATVEESAGHGAQPDSDQNDREKQRVHRPEAADGMCDVAEPDDLHAHGGETCQQKGEPAQDDDGLAALRLRHPGFHLPSVEGRVAGDGPFGVRRGAGSRQAECARSGYGVADHGDDLGAEQARRGNEGEVGEKGARGGAGGVDPVERADLPSSCGHVALNQVPNQKGECRSHQEGDRQEQEDGDAVAPQMGAGGEEVPAVGARDVGGDGRREPSKPGQDQRDQATHSADGQFGVSEGLEK